MEKGVSMDGELRDTKILTSGPACLRAATACGRWA